jgi:hypothetical protein
MPDPAERFIDAATSPLVDNPELQIAARQELAGSIGSAVAGTGDSLDTAAARLEAADRKPHGEWWRPTVYITTAIISAWVLVTSWSSFALAREALNVIGNLGGISLGSSGENAWEKRFSKNLTPEQKLLLMGDTRRQGKAAQFAALWESDPENPAYYADYASAYFFQHDSPPPDFLETARKLDPDNGWFPGILAGQTAKQALDSSSSAKSTTAKSPGGVKIKLIKDPAKLDEAMALLHEASTTKRIDSYQLAMVRQRIPLLPPRTDNLTQLGPVAYVAGLPALNLRFRYLADAVAAKAIQLAAAKDTEGFKRLLADWEAFTALHVRAEHGSLVDVMVAVVCTQGPLKALSEAASDLGMPDEAARLKALDQRFEERRAAIKSRTDPNANMAMHSATLAGLSLPVVSKQSMHSPVLTEADLRPGRLADRATIDRFMSVAGWLLLGLAALATGLYRHRCGRLSKRLSERMVLLIRPLDWFWIFGAGIVLPLLYYVVISRYTPLGGRDWSLKASAFAVPAGQFSSMLWLMIVLPVVIIRPRLSVRGRATGLASGKQVFGWISVACGFLALPCFGLTLVSDSPSEKLLIVAGLLLGALQVYALVAGIRALFSKPPSLLRRAAISRALLPAYVVGMAAMVIALLGFHEEEKHWIAQDRLMEVTVEAPSMSRFEYQVSQTMIRELQELVKEAP